MKTLCLALTLLISTNITIAAEDFSPVKSKLEKALKSDVRGDRDKVRDRNRRPIQTLEFFGLRDNMKIIELLPGGGWYTKLLAPVMAEKGQFYVAIGTGGVENTLFGKKGFEKAKALKIGTSINRPKGSRFYTLGKFDLGVNNIDMVLTFRNYHNFAEEGRMNMNRAAFAALKPGGIYAVVDHTRRHMQDLNNENGRRVDPVLAIKEIESAGFEFVDYSKLHYRPDDELRYEVGRKTVTGNTDRFTFKFRKPLK